MSDIVAIRLARTEYPSTGAGHLFLAVPAGLAVMIGQRLNTLWPVRVYEHLPEGATGTCEAAVTLHPGA